MVVTNYAKTATAWAIGSNLANNYMSYLAIGSGTNTAGSTDVTLYGELLRGQVTNSYSTVNIENPSYNVSGFGILDVSILGETFGEFFILDATGSPIAEYALKQEVTFNSVQMSGLNISEFGLFASGVANVGSTWQREKFTSYQFDGTEEAVLINTIQVV